MNETEYMQPFTQEPIDPNLLAVQCLRGEFIINKNGRYLEEGLIKYGEFMEEERRVFEMICKPGNFAIDIGANIGLHTRNLSDIVGEKGIVWAVEPQPYLVRLLGENIKRNPYPNTTLHHIGLGEEPGEFIAPYYDISKTTNFGGVALIENNENNQRFGIKVNVQPLDNIQYPRRVNFIKMDVEGMEEQILKGGAQLLKNHRPAVYCENDRAMKYMGVLQKFWEYNYKVYWHLAPYITRFRDNYRNHDLAFQDPDIGLKAINIICLPAEHTINCDLVESTPEKPTSPEVQGIFDAMIARGRHLT